MTSFKTLSAAAACAVLFSAQAADPPKADSVGKGKAGGPLLTRAELRDCMAQKDRVRTQGEEVLKLVESMDKEKAEIKSLGGSLKERLAALDRTDAAAVDAYNLQAQDLDKRVAAYNAGTPAFNAKADALKSEREAYAKACENRRFDERDEIAIKKGQ
jgi:hypothetical protein